MLKKAAGGVLWAARGTATIVGLAVMIAAVLGVGTAALAAVPGDPFKLGRTNAVNALTQLTGSNAGPMLRVENGSSAARARALALQVRPGKAPLTVNADAGRATNLNADKLDGKSSGDFVGGTYGVVDGGLGPGGGATVDRGASCDEGDVALGGGGLGTVDDDDLKGSLPSGNGWIVRIQDNGVPSQLIVRAVCADFPPLRP